MTSEEMTAKIFRAIEQAPEWLRVDLVSKDQAARLRAEETLAARVYAALNNGDIT